MAFVARITRGYFPLVSDGMLAHIFKVHVCISVSSNKVSNKIFQLFLATKNVNLEKAREVELRNKRIRTALSFAFAVASMTGFAIYNNIYQVS